MGHVNGQRWVVALSAAAWLVLGATVAQAQAAPSGDAWWGEDKALHFSFSAAISVGSYALALPLWDEPLTRTVFAASIGLSAGVAKELYDLAGYGDPSYRDLTWDVIGVTVGTLLSLLIDLWLRDDGAASEQTRAGRALQSVPHRTRPTPSAQAASAHS